MPLSNITYSDESNRITATFEGIYTGNGNVSNNQTDSSETSAVSSFEVDTEDIVDQIRWVNRHGAQIGDFNFGARLSKMEEGTLDAWFYNHARSALSTDILASAYSGERYDDTNGVSAIVHAVLEDTSQNIQEQVDNGEAPVYAFNGETRGWPHRARAKVAGYELNYGDVVDDNNGYRSNIKDFAMSEGFADYSPVQATIDVYDGEDVYTSDDIPNERVKAFVVMQAYGASAEQAKEYLPEVGSVDDFLVWLHEFEDIESAIDAEGYDSAIGSDVLAVCASPDDWTELDPEDIDEERCTRCRDSYYRVEIETDGDVHTEWVNNDGVSMNVRDIGPGTGRRRPGHPHSDGIICPACYDDVRSTWNLVTVKYPDGNSITLNGNDAVLEERDISGRESFESLTDEQLAFASQVIGTVPNRYIEIESGDGPADPVLQDDAFESIFDGDSGLPSVEEPLAVLEYNSFGNDEYIVYIPRYCADTAMAAKRILEQPAEFINA